MCGILGCWYRTKTPDLSWFPRGLETLHRRGPDGSSVVELFHRSIALGHTRLAIIDLSTNGTQPLSNEDGTVWITFNGEIYNYRSLRNELVEAGHQFRTQTDTEVIVHAYEEWGVDCVLRFDGIFAFGIWDANQERLLLARDPVGVKPLYYTTNHDPFLFASQPKALQIEPTLDATVDRVAFRDYLSFGYVPEPNCIFENISRLSPGHTLTVTRDTIDLSRYWRCEYRPRIRSVDEAAASIAGILSETVRSQMVSDVPLGTLLSGGIDSTYLTALATQHLGPDLEKLRTFTLGFDEAKSDEREFANLAVRHYQTNHFDAVLSSCDMASQLEDVVQAFDEPFDPNGPLPATRIASLVRSTNTKVVLGGDGGDELFAGYLRYDAHSSVNNASMLRQLSDRLFGRTMSPHCSYFRHEGACGESLLRMIIPGSHDSEWWSAPTDSLKSFFESSLPPVTQCQMADFNHYLPGHILTKVDRAMMHHGVEARVPFLGKCVVELAFSIAAEVNYASGERKAALKRAAQGTLPQSLLNGRKKGFSSPMSAWTVPAVRAWALSRLAKGCLVQLGLIRPDAGARVNRMRGHAAFRAFWLLLMAELWAENWVVRDANRLTIPDQFAKHAA